MTQETNKALAKKQNRKFGVDIDPDDPLFVISVVQKMVGIPIWTLRKLDEIGVVKPKRIGKKTRCYSKIQVQQLNYVHYLMDEKGVNISGIKIILQLDNSQGKETKDV